MHVRSSNNNTNSSHSSTNGIYMFLQAFVTTLTPHCHTLHAHTQAANSGNVMQPVNPHSHLLAGQLREALKTARNQVLLAHQSQQTARQRKQEGQRGHTIMLPLLQLAPVGLWDESLFLPRMLRALATGTTGTANTTTATGINSSSSPLTRLYVRNAMVSSPYPSFPASFSTALGELSAYTQIDVIAPSATSHGFGTATGVKSLLPRIHDAALHQALHSAKIVQNNTMIVKHKRKSEGDVESKEGDKVIGIDLWRYSRPGWTFHSKGFWASLSLFPSSSSSYTDANNTTEDKDIEDPTSVELSYIGSSNLGSRSMYRDMELGFILVTRDPCLRSMLRKERQSLLRHSLLASSSGGTGRAGAGRGMLGRSGSGSSSSVIKSKISQILARLIKTLL